ncbi:MAG: hypothetical protein RLZZ116_1775 [Planctomycetota bacterium]|jgi:YHS domain-containing protein
MKTRSFLAACTLFAALSGLALTSAPIAGDSFKGEAFPLETCPVSGEKLGADAVTVVLKDMKDANLNGTQMKFCCGKCEAAFKADPAKYIAKVDEAIVKAAAPYALGTCLVMTDEAIDDSAKTVVYHNRVYKLCCKKCVARFSKDPAKYETAYETALIAKLKPAYKATKCPISGEAIKADSTDVIVSGRLVRTCCPKCAEKAKADPKGTLGKIDAQVASAESGSKN